MEKDAAAGTVFHEVGGVDYGIEEASLEGVAGGVGGLDGLDGLLDGVGVGGEVEEPGDFVVEGDDGGLAAVAGDEGLDHDADAADFGEGGLGDAGGLDSDDERDRC